MIIGAKRKEEVIKTKAYGIFQEYHITPIKPVSSLALYKGLRGWEVWEMIHDSTSNLERAYRPIAGYKTKKETIQRMEKIAKDCNLPILTDSKGKY